jgi:hypothetical protein
MWINVFSLGRFVLFEGHLGLKLFCIRINTVFLLICNLPVDMT